MGWLTSFTLRKKKMDLHANLGNVYKSVLKTLVRQKNVWQRTNNRLEGAATKFAGLAAKNSSFRRAYLKPAREAAKNSANFRKFHNAYREQVGQWTRAGEKNPKRPMLSLYPYAPLKTSLQLDSAIEAVIKSIKGRENKRENTLRMNTPMEYDPANNLPKREGKAKTTIFHRVQGRYYSTRGVPHRPLRTMESALRQKQVNNRNKAFAKLLALGPKHVTSAGNSNSNRVAAAKLFATMDPRHQQAQFESAVKLAESGRPLTREESLFVSDMATLLRARG